MKTAVFSSKPHDFQFLSEANQKLERPNEFNFLELRLTEKTVRLAEGHQAVCGFVNDEFTAQVLKQLAAFGIKIIALRCAGFNNVDLEAAEELGLPVVRVPYYSPHAVAEHTLCLMLALNRQVYRAHQRIREGDFSLHGLMGFDMFGKTVGVIGTGAIGQCVVRILNGLGCHVLAYDVHPQPAVVAAGATYVDLETVLFESDIVTLHCPLLPDTHHLISAKRIERMRPGVMIINTSRGGLVDARAVIDGLKSRKIGALGLDVYEEEADLFFEDRSNDLLQDDVFARLTTFPNVLVTGHQAFFTKEALQQIAKTTVESLAAFEANLPLTFQVQKLND